MTGFGSVGVRSRLGAVVTVVILAGSANVALAGSNTEPVELRCNKRLLKDVSNVDPIAQGYSMLRKAAERKRMDMEASAALGEFDTLLTSYYGLRKPLATLTDTRHIRQMSDMAQLVMSGYVVAAQMTHGLVKKEGRVPAEMIRISGNMVFTALEPDGADPALGIIDAKVKQADLAISKISKDALPFARWAIRGYAYNDPIAVDASLYGYCAAVRSPGDDALFTEWARKVRLDPKSIVIIKD